MIKIISEDKNKITFVSDISESLANAVRRSVLEIPILAIDEVEFFKNDSALYDEILAHRLGLVPFVTEKNIVEREKCTCKGKGCGKCSIDLKINLKGVRTVYSRDIKGKAKVVYENIPIVILSKDQELELVARARLGKGIKHIKFSPGLVHYRNLAKITVNKECDDCKKCVEKCPQKVLKIENKKPELVDIYKCDLCEACVEACKKHGKNAIQISKDDNSIFFIESWGQIVAKDIFIGAVNKLNENLKELSKKVK